MDEEKKEEEDDDGGNDDSGGNCVPLLEDATDIVTIVKHRTRRKGKPEMYVEWDNGFSGWFEAENIRSDVPGLYTDYIKTNNPKGTAWEVSK